MNFNTQTPKMSAYNVGQGDSKLKYRKFSRWTIFHFKKQNQKKPYIISIYNFKYYFNGSIILIVNLNMLKLKHFIMD